MGNENSSHDSESDVELADLFAQFWSWNYLPSSFVEWAVRELVKGKDTPNLRILAGLSGDDRDEVMFHLSRALKELGIPWPAHRACLMGYSKRIAQRIVKQQVTPAAGYSLIYEVLINLGYPDELRGWLEMEIDFYRYEGADDEAKQIDLRIVEEAKRFITGN